MSSDANPGTPRPFDVKTVEHLIGLMAQHDLTEIALREGDQRIRLRKGGEPVPVVTAVAAPAPAAPVQAAPGTPPLPAAPTKKLHDIKSEMVGTFYSRPKPDKDDYVKAGGTVKKDVTTICLIEAMKIFNEIKSDVSGTVVEVCVKNGDPVDFGTVLYRVDPS